MKTRVKKFFIITISTILVILAIILFIYSISGITSTIKKNNTVTEEKLILGFSQIGSESAWRTRNTQSIFEAAQAHNIQILFDDAQQKQSNQLKAIRSYIVYQVDVIAFVPIVQTGWDNVLQEAKDAGIPVIIVDRKIDASPTLYAGFLGEDGYSEGQKAGNFLVSKTQDINSPINILELAGTENSSVATDRATGFRNIISKDSKFKIIHSEDGDFLSSRGKEIMDRIITENNGLFYDNKKIDVIYSHNDSMTLGLLDSMKENNLSSDDLIIISIDGEQKSIDALKEGYINCVVECNPNQGETLMKLVMDISSGKSIPEITYIKETIFTEDDDFSTYSPRGY